MIKNFLLSSFLFLGLLGVFYPIRKENAKKFDYCNSFEEILLRNSLKSSRYLSKEVRLISRDFARFGIKKTNGALVQIAINQYKNSKNSFFLNIFPNNFYCLAGYWIEEFKPGTFEVILYEKSKKGISVFKDMYDELDGLIEKNRSKYKIIKKEFYNIFK